MIRDWWIAHRFEIYVDLGLIVLVCIIAAVILLRGRPRRSKPIDWSKHVPVGGGGSVVVEPEDKCITGEHYRVYMGASCDKCGMKSGGFKDC